MRTLSVKYRHAMHRSLEHRGLAHTCERFNVRPRELYRALAEQPVEPELAYQIARGYYRLPPAPLDLAVSA
jgi:hypothetical protein